MRLNKEPPDDTPVVEFVGVSETTTPASVASLSARHGGISGVVRGLPTGASGDAGAGALAAVAEIANEEKDPQEEELKKIKGGELGDDDNCVVCLSGERRYCLSG